MELFWKVVLFLFLIFGAHQILHADAAVSQVQSVKAIRISEKVILDGKPDEAFWKDTNAATEFFQREPEEGKPATEKTVVDIVYDDEAIYVGARMYDSNPQGIVARLQRKDVDVDSDTFVFYVDPYLDRRTGFYFGVNAAGTQYDGTLLNDSWDSSSWDGVWEARAHINDTGWTVEMRIPFSQLRFQRKDVQTWGVNFKRGISRKNEYDYLVFQPRNGSGFVSRFPTLVGLQNISSPKNIQLLPYVTSRATMAPVTTGDPLNNGTAFDPGAGADLMMGVGSGLTLNATLNPDFGQVEVDPAVVNLSDVETFYPEKRPFFIEGSNIFEFGEGGATNYWGFNWANPTFFYSRRIGRAPQGTVDDADYSSVPDGTTIIGAGKLTGKVWNGWNVGTLHAFTAKEYASLATGTESWQQEVEPATYYEVSRAQHEYNDGKQGLGFITTLSQRFFDDVTLKDELNSQSFVMGVDGWTFLDSNKTWVLTGYTGYSRVSGTQARITDVQESSQRYFQRPDADYLHLDPTATSLSGGVGRVYLNKEKGNTFLNAAFGVVSPGFDVNDLGFLWRADQINMHAGAGYKWTEPKHFYRYAEVGGAYFHSYDFGGSTIWEGVYQFNNVEFKNYYSVNFSWAANPQTFNNFRTRGGPKSLNMPGFETNFSFNTDSRKKIVFGVNEYSYEAEQEHDRSAGFSVEWKPAANISFSIGPSYEVLDTPAQWIDNYVDPYATATYGNRYVFGQLKQKTFAANIRLNWTFTPKLSLQLFGQPLVSSGDYSDFKELAAPRTYDFNHYDQTGTVVLNDGTYTIDPDAGGPAAPISFDNPDFNYRSLRGNAVLRWEYRPGSTLYFVWTQSRQETANTGDFRLGQSLSELARTDATNVFMIKLTYYFNF